jgi:hypothetical protein
VQCAAGKAEILRCVIDIGVDPTQNCRQHYRENLESIMWGAEHARIQQVTQGIFRDPGLSSQRKPPRKPRLHCMPVLGGTLHSLNGYL